MQSEYYRHFRNKKIYRFVTFATFEATEEDVVVYQAISKEEALKEILTTI